MKLKRHFYQDRLVRTDAVNLEDPKYLRREDGSVLVLGPTLLSYPIPGRLPQVRLPEGLTDDDLVKLGKARLVESGKVVEVLPGAVKGVQVLQADRGVQHFTDNFIDGGIQEGWLSMGNGRLILHTVDDKGEPAGNLVYKIVRTPGYYCCHNDAPIPDAGAWEFRKGVKKTKGQWYCEDNFPGQPSPDPNNVSGYRKESHYTCVNEGVAVNKLTLEQAQQFEEAKRRLLWSTTDRRPLTMRVAGDSSTLNTEGGQS